MSGRFCGSNSHLGDSHLGVRRDSGLTFGTRESWRSCAIKSFFCCKVRKRLRQEKAKRQSRRVPYAILFQTHYTSRPQSCFIFPEMLLAPASKGHKVVFTGCLFSHGWRFGGLRWVVIERNWLSWMALAISGWMFGVWMLILSSVDPTLVRSLRDIGFFTNCRGDSS